MDDWAKQRLAELHEAAPPKRKKREPFVRVPLTLAAKAAAATGSKRMLVWLHLLHKSWLEQKSTVAVSTSALRKYGINREMKRRALKDLEAAGLIAVDWRLHKNPIATLL